MNDALSDSKERATGNSVAPRQSRRESSPDESVHAGERANVNTTRITISERTLSTIALIAAVAGLMAAFWAMDRAHRADMSAELLRIEVYGFKNAMHAHGIKDTNPHLPGELP